MAGRKILPLLLVAVLSTVDAASPATTVKAGYWPAWSASYCAPSVIDASLFTHLFYAFVEIDPASYRLVVTPTDAPLLSNFTATMGFHNPPVKTLLSIGGATANKSAFALMASSPCGRRAFIDSTVSVARSYGFDGLDIDWEFPQNRREMHDFGRLLSHWRLALEEEACATGKERLLLTAATYYSSESVGSVPDLSYPTGSIRRNLDWVNVMTYDYHGSWDKSATGSHAALYDPSSIYSTSFGVRSWLGAGVPSEKVVMGLPLYGRTWKLKDNVVNGIGAPAVDVGPGDGMMTLGQVVSFNSAMNATVVHDGPTFSTYSYAGNAWISYDDESSVQKKIEFAMDHKLGGYFFWAINQDSEWSVSRQAWKAWEN